MQCDAFYPLKLAGKHAHLSSLGVNCTLGGVKRIEETVFICAYRMDTFMCATGILADLVDAPLPVPPQTNDIYGSFFNLDERGYRAKLAAMVQPEDVPSIQAAVKRVAETFATRTSTWEKALCYEMVPMAHPGESQTRVQAVEHGCIWMNRARNETVAFHIEPTAGKYYLALSELLGLHWHSMNYLSLGSNVFLRARTYMNDHYNVTQTLDGQKYIRHEDDADLGVDGVLYIVMILIEVIIILINVTDVGIVATSVVRPLVNSTRRSSTYSSTSTLTSRTSITSKVSGRGSFLSLRKVSLLKRQRTTSFNKDTTQGDRDNTLSKTLLYTDLTSVSYRKPLLSALVLIDAILSSLFVVPNSNVFAWASSAYQLGSAYLSMFRV